LSNLTPILGDPAVNLTFTISQAATGGLTGQTVTVVVRRVADGFNLDWADNTFKAAGHTTLNGPMTEVDATDNPGVYERIWDSSLSVSAVGPYVAEYKNTTAGKQLKSQDFINIIKIADQVWNEILTGATHNIQNSAGKILRELKGGLAGDTAQGGSSNTITLAAGESSTDDIFNEVAILIIDGTGKQQARVIIDYDGTTKIATVHRDWEITPDATSEYVGLSLNTAILLAATQTSIDDIQAKTDNLPVDPASEANATTNTALINTNIDANEVKIDTIDGIVDAILVIVQAIQPDTSLSRKMLVNRLELSDDASGNWVLRDDDDTVLLTFTVTDKGGLTISTPSGVPMRRTKGTT